MKAVMLSIKPKWCELIASGKKTVEVRKTKPKLETSFKCYIYYTKGSKDDILWTSGTVGRMSDKANGKVIGEFVCDNIELLDIEQTNCLSKACKDIDTLKNNSCLSSYDLLTYLQSKNGYAWHISDLVIYDKPKELSEFRTVCQYRNDDGSCQYDKIDCDCSKFDFNPDYSVAFAKCCDYMDRPPQSWQYVEEFE